MKVFHELFPITESESFETFQNGCVEVCINFRLAEVESTERLSG